MERMGDILAKNASRRRATSGPLTPVSAAKPETASSAPPTVPGRAAPSGRIQRATSTAPVVRRVTPRPRATPVVPGVTIANRQLLGPATNRYRSAPDTQPLATPQPSADTLDSERILELPRRTAGPARRAPLASADAQQPVPPAADALAIAERPVVPSRAQTSGRMSSPLPLRAVAESYLAGQARKSAPASAPAATHAPARKAEKAKRDPNVCPHCGGTGWVRLDVPVGDPAFGKAIACSCKERQQEERRRSDLRELSSLEPFRDKTFETFDLRAAPGLEEAFLVAREYAKQPEGWLVLRGGYGTGKTHLAAAIANSCLAAGSPVFFSIVPDLLDHLRAAFAPTSELTYDTLFDRIREVELLVLDDLGAENGTAWATEKLFQLINYRYNFRFPTVITTNNRLLSHMDDRIASRLSDVGLVQNVVIDGPDYRKRHTGNASRARRAGDAGAAPRGRGSGG